MNELKIINSIMKFMFNGDNSTDLIFIPAYLRILIRVKDR